ncbi:MAG TPA: EutN/CcmL family microcompartment protein [bacterium]|nr:EutN/CcmL family microcompartment protein [bacterium]
MYLARVVGNVVSTQKDPGLIGWKMLMCENLDMRTSPPKGTGSFSVVVDLVGAGNGEIVIIVSGSSARMTDRTKTAPVDTAIVGIVDTLEVNGETIYCKKSTET